MTEASDITAGIQVVQGEVAKFDAIAAGIATLEKEHPKDVACDCTTTAGMKQAVAGRAAWREPRIAVEKARKAAKAPVLDLGRQIDSFAKDLEQKLLAGESNYDDQIKAEEGRKEAERIAKRDADAKRVLAHLSGIEAIQSLAARYIGESSAAVAAAIEQYEAAAPEGFEEFQAQANAAHAAALKTLREAHAAAVEREAAAAKLKAEQEAETARIAAERAELARLRAEQAKRDEEERARQAEANRLEQARIAAERAELAQQQQAARAEQNRLDAEAAERRRLADKEAADARAEADRAARAEREAERQRIEEQAAAHRQRLAAEEQARRDDEAKQRAILAAARDAQERMQGAAQKLFDALILAAPFVTDPAVLDACNEAIAEATGEPIAA